jgi:hypothetical protein
MKMAQHVDLIHIPIATVFGILVMLLIAGTTKGLIGIGMPIIAVPLLNLIVELPVTVAILTIPLILSNIPQAIEGEKVVVVLRRLLPIFYGLIFGVIFGVYLLSSVRLDLLKPIVGVILIVVVFLMLLSPRFQVPAPYEKYLSPAVGFVGGVLGGLAALPGPFVFIYILALGISKDRFIQYSSMFLVVAATLMTITLGGMGTIGLSDALLSTLAVIPVLIGMKLGAGLRDFLSPAVFRKVILCVVMLSGINLTLGALRSAALAFSSVGAPPQPSNPESGWDHR